MEKASTHFLRSCLIALVSILFACSTYGQNADINILEDINLNRNRSLDRGMEALTNSVYPLSAAAPVAELIVGYTKHDKKLVACGWTTIAGLGANFIVTFGLKHGVDRTRPYITYPVLQPYKRNNDASFPSGHTSFAFNTATALSMQFPKWYVALPAYGWATAVGYSRMHLGMHYPSDVLAGAIIGTGTAILAKKGNEWLQHRKRKKTLIEH